MRVANEAQVSRNFHPPANFGNNAAHDCAAYLQANLLGAALTALVATLYPSSLFILEGSSAHSRLIRIIAPSFCPSLLSNFPVSLPPFAATHRQSATLRAATPLSSAVKLSGAFVRALRPPPTSGESIFFFFGRSDHRLLCASPSKFLPSSPLCLEYQPCESAY